MTDPTAAAPLVWILDCTYLDTISAYATEYAARAAAEAYVTEHAERQPIAEFDWRHAPDGEPGDGGMHELWGKWEGTMYPANMIIYPLPVLDTPGSDGGHEAAA